MPQKIITICSSGSFYKRVCEIADELGASGFEVRIPTTATAMRERGDYDISQYKTWYNNPEDFHRKTFLMNEHFEKVRAADAVLVVNLEKNGVPGYIGGNVLMEMLVAYLDKKPIYVLHPVTQELPLYEEVLGMQPIFIHGELSKITTDLKTL